MAWRVGTTARNAMADALANLPDGGTIEIRTGTRPTSVNDAATGTLLATFPLLATDSFTRTTDGVVDVDADPDITATAAATGTPAWGRILTSTGAVVVDGTAGTSGTDFVLNTATITSGDTVTLLQGSLTVPSGE